MSLSLTLSLETCLQGVTPRGRWVRRLLHCCLRARGFRLRFRHIHICMYVSLCVCVCVCVYNRFVYSVFVVLHHHRHLQISLFYLVSWILIELEILRSGSGEYLAKHMCHYTAIYVSWYYFLLNMWQILLHDLHVHCSYWHIISPRP